MQGNQGYEAIRVAPGERSATRYKVNPNWYWRGDNAKPKAKK